MAGDSWRRGVRVVVLAVALVVAQGSARTIRAGEASDAQADCNSYCYNTDYLFVVTRGVHDRVSDPALVLLSPLTLAVDLAFLPFAVALGLFG